MTLQKSFVLVSAWICAGTAIFVHMASPEFPQLLVSSQETDGHQSGKKGQVKRDLVIRCQIFY